MKPHAQAMPMQAARPVVAAARPVADLRPRDLTGTLYLGLSLSITAAAVALSLSANLWGWLGGQFLLAIAMVQWFAVLHEAGHKTLFRTRWLNKWVAHVAGFFALIPADCWRMVHAKHHFWTGWQDLDITTSTLVPRRLRSLERWGINFCWRLWIPLFATLYRLNNYWNLPRLFGQFTRSRERRLLVINIVGYVAAYAVVIWAVGPFGMLKCVGFALLISFAIQDLLILSQHTHIPMKLSHGEDVNPFAPVEQAVFTRSLEFPLWFSRLILLNFDAHALHHMYPKIPGYDLHLLQAKTENSIAWWRWMIKAKSVRGDVLLFQNRDQTGFYF